MKQALLALPELPDKQFPSTTNLDYTTEVASAVHGTSAWIQQGLTRSMFEEFRQNEAGKWLPHYEYVVHQPAEESEHMLEGADRRKVVHEKGHGGWHLEDFENTPSSRKAKLTQAEIAAVRIYTSPRFSSFIKSVLRSQDAAVIQLWATTISLLISAIVKISEQSTPDTTTYRADNFIRFPIFTGNTVAESYVEPGFSESSKNYKNTPPIKRDSVVVCL